MRNRLLAVRLSICSVRRDLRKNRENRTAIELFRGCVASLDYAVRQSLASLL